MGTTMHAHIEVKKEGKWLHYGCPDVDRNYLAFACINGTRKEAFEAAPDVYNSIHPIVTVHELPEDMSEVTRICLEQDSCQYALKGFGVLNADNLNVLQKQLNGIASSQKGYATNDLEADIFKTYIGGNSIARHEGFDDVRILFWFDN